MMDQNPYQAPQAPTTQLAYDGPTDWKWLLFSFEGRITRGKYWLASLALTAPLLVLLIPTLILSQTSAEDGGPPVAILILFGLLGIYVLAILWSSLAIAVKRWHDRNKSGWWVLIGLVPYIGSFWTLIECGCLAGTQGPNQYG